MELNQETVDRYSRQLILNEVGLEGQTKLKNAKIIVIGAGGLGCPLSLYCCAAGVGTIGIIDNDTVDASNLHRQICHDVNHLGTPKVDSIEKKLNALNPLVKIIKYQTKLNRSNAVEIFSNFDVIVDCSDNAPTRYLASDASVLLRKPLVSASALRFEGQLSVYRPFELGNPCYRCIFPDAPDPSLTGSCSTAGVMGFVCGVMGSVQAQEVVKQIVGLNRSLVGKMLIYSALDCSFRTIKLRSKVEDCVCNSNPKSLQCFKDVVFECSPPLMILKDKERILPDDYSKMIAEKTPHLLIDVRNFQETQFSNLGYEKPGDFLHLPIKKITDSDDISAIVSNINTKMSELKDDCNLIVVMCKRGNNSQKAVQKLKQTDLVKQFELKDVKGGLLGLKDLIPDSNIFDY